MGRGILSNVLLVLGLVIVVPIDAQQNSGQIDLWLNNPQLDRSPGRASANAVYYGVYYVGTPPKQFLGCYDTGSADIWLPSSTCQSEVCKGHDQYNAQDSSTKVIPPTNQQKTVTIKYGTGNVVATALTDDFTFGGVPVTGQKFGSASVLSQDFSSISCDGLVGLGFAAVSNMGALPFLFNAGTKGALAQNLYGLYLNPSPNEEPAGSLAIGQIEPSKFTGDIISLPVTKNMYWTVSLQGLTLGQRKFTPSVSEAILDSGTTAIYLPASDAQDVNSAIPSSSYWPQQDIWNVTCDYSQLPDLVFKLGNSQFALPATLYVQQLQSTSGRPLGICASSIIGGQENRLILGTNFLRGWYTTYTFDPSTSSAPAKVGLAKAAEISETATGVQGRRLQSTTNRQKFDINKLFARPYDSFDQPRWGWVHPSRRAHNAPPQSASVAL